MKLANEDPMLQAKTQITVSQTPNKHTAKANNTEDPYPWLDVETKLEIGTCPYFELKLKLRDDKTFFVRPYNIRKDQKPIIQKKMDRLEKLGIIRKVLTDTVRQSS